jgi:RHS repeat-associated protein
VGPDSANNPNQYTSRENDNTGLYYYRARYYDPVMKRFISSDPIGLAGGWNTYAYVGGNPISYTDPLGLRRGGNGKGPQSAPTIGPFGCVFGACASSNNLSSEAQLSFELTLGGGLEICDAPAQKPEIQSCEKPKKGTVIDPGGPPIPKRFGGAFFGVGIKSDGSFCVRLGPHISVPFVPSFSKAQ